MNVKTNYKRYSLFALALTFLVCLAAALGIYINTNIASASRDIELTGSNYFYTSNSADISAYDINQDNSNTNYYQTFVFTDDEDYVTYRKNLAYKWFTSDSGTADYFSLSVGFTALNFETFTIKFQSQQYTLTEDAVTTNYLTFVAGAYEGNDCVYIIVTEDEPTDDDINQASSNSEAYGYDKITISFTGYNEGVYSVSITANTTYSSVGSYTYEFKNVGSTYSKYVSSSSNTSVIPLTFSADLPDGATDDVEMILYELNTQEFSLKDVEFDEETGEYISGTVTDNVAPVVCLDDDFTTVRYGYGLELNYAVIDVLATSPRTTINYYILTETQAASSDDLNGNDDEKYTSVSSTDTYAFIDVPDYYGNTLNGKTSKLTDTAQYGYKTRCLVKIYLTVKDSTSSKATSDDVYLEWYVEDSTALEQVANSYNTSTTYNFIRVVEDYTGVAYNYTYADNQENTSENMQHTHDAAPESVGTDSSYVTYGLSDLQTSYQSKVTAAIAEQKTTAGDGKYFYLPSLEGFVTDNTVAYKDLVYTVYYTTGSSVSSNTSLDYNKLCIEVDEAGTYRFAVYVTDTDGNEMYYWSYDSTDDCWEMVTFDSSDVSDMLDNEDSELWYYLPTFTFTISYAGLEIGDNDAQSIAYVGTSYSIPDFDITGLDGGYEVTYYLYEFDREAYYNYKKEKGEETTISYAEMLEQVADLFGDGETRVFFRTIKAESDIEETDEDYEDYCDYEWDDANLTFVPQEENTFYIIRAEIKDTNYLTNTQLSFMVISSSAAAEELKGESRWVKDNIASIVLLSIAGAALIGIVLLIFIKPKEKGDIDVIDADDDKKGKKGKKAKKTTYRRVRIGKSK